MNSHSTIAPASPLEALKAEIALRRQEFQELRHIPVDIVRRFQEVGVYRAFVPKRFGGDGLTPQAFCRLVEEIATADASAGWVASFGVSATYLAALPPETYAKIYGADPNTVFAGAMFPPQPAHRVDGGFEVSGRWPWGSGVMGASIVGAGIKVEGEASPLPRTAIMPRDKVSVDETWNTIGLRATGSHDIVADRVVVPEDWTFIRGGKPQMEDAIFRYPAMALAAQVLAVVALGAARAGSTGCAAMRSPASPSRGRRAPPRGPMCRSILPGPKACSPVRAPPSTTPSKTAGVRWKRPARSIARATFICATPRRRRRRTGRKRPASPSCSAAPRRWRPAIRWGAP